MDRMDRYRRRALLGVAGSLACAAVLLIGLDRWFDHQDAQMAELRAAAEAESVPVVVATRELLPGYEITAEDLEVVEVDPRLAPPDAARSAGFLIGRIPAERILPGETVRDERLADFGAARGLAALVPPGLRALSLNLRNAPAGAGFLVPGDRVDVQVTAQVDGDVETFLLLENVPVLAVDGAMTEATRREGETDTVGRPSPGVTVLVTPEEAVKLTHAHRQGAVSLAMRSRIDLDSVATTAVNMRSLLGRNSTPVRRVTPKTPDVPQTGIITIIRADQQTIETYPLDDPTSVGL